MGTRIDSEGIQSKPPGGSTSSGCFRLLLAGPLLLVGAPLVALMRSLARWRRGDESRLEDMREEESGRYRIFNFGLDYPSSLESCHLLTAALAPLASALSGPGDHHYLIYREEDATILLGIGPSIQELAERFHIMCRKSSVEARSLLWLSMDRSEYIGEYLEAETCDPDAGDTGRLLAEAPLKWALKIRRKRSAVSTRYEISLRVPEDRGKYARDFFSRLVKN